MKRIYILIILICSFFMLSAQDKEFFEGELLYRTFENHSEVVLKFSKGVAYNGARNTRIIIKDANIHRIDESLHIHTLLLPTRNKAIIYSDLLKKGLEFSYDDFTSTYLATFSPQKSNQDSHIENTMILTRDKRRVLNELCDIYKGQYNVGDSDNKINSDIDVWVIPKYKVFKSYWATINGLHMPGIVAKYTYNQKGHVFLLGTLASYVASELKQITPREVSPSEIVVPNDCYIKTSASSNDLLDFHEQTTNYLKKHNMYPTQKNNDIIYKINENWDF